MRPANENDLIRALLRQLLCQCELSPEDAEALLRRILDALFTDGRADA